MGPRCPLGWVRSYQPLHTVSDCGSWKTFPSMRTPACTLRQPALVASSGNHVCARLPPDRPGAPGGQAGSSLAPGAQGVSPAPRPHLSRTVDALRHWASQRHSDTSSRPAPGFVGAGWGCRTPGDTLNPAARSVAPSVAHAAARRQRQRGARADLADLSGPGNAPRSKRKARVRASAAPRSR